MGALLVIATVILATYVAFVFFYENRKKFWLRRGVPFVPITLPFFGKKTKERRADFLNVQEQYIRFKSQGEIHFGTFQALKPIYIPIHQDLVRNVLAKDFANFMDRGMYYDEKHDPISGQLFNLEGQKWKNLRAKLTPTFTSGKMKMMFQTLVDCGGPMVDRLDKQCKQKKAVDIKEILACFTTDVIGSCAFGLECNSFQDENKDSAFRAAGKNFFGFNRWRLVRIILIRFIPEICKLLRVKMFEKSLTDFYFNVVRDTVKYREENNISRNDFMQLLLELKKNNGLTIGEIAAQSILFFLAGFETSSTLMHFCFYELTQHPEVQEKLRKEIFENIKENGGELTYDGVMGMKYLGQVLDGNFVFN